MPEGHYELLSGETRWLALQALNGSLEHLDQWPTIQARILHNVSDAQSLWDVAVGNTGRKDLNPIERAQLMAELMRPVEEAGGGRTAAEVADLFGLSEVTVRSTVRLTKLPRRLQEAMDVHRSAAVSGVRRSPVRR